MPSGQLLLVQLCLLLAAHSLGCVFPCLVCLLCAVVFLLLALLFFLGQLFLLRRFFQLLTLALPKLRFTLLDHLL